MRILLQRVKTGGVSIDQKSHATIDQGLVALVGIKEGDDLAIVQKLAKKTANLRIFADQDQKLNLSVKDISGEVLAISQFTLYADCSRGNRPSFGAAAKPELANQLYQAYIEALKAEGVSVKSGVFQADMLVDIANDGPVTVLLEG